MTEANYLKNFADGETIYATEINANNQYLLDKISDNATVVQQYVASQVASVKSEVANVKRQKMELDYSNATKQPLFELNQAEIMSWALPDYSKGVSLATSKGDHTIPINAYVYVRDTAGTGTLTVKCDGEEVFFNDNDVNYTQPVGVCLLVPENSVLNFSRAVNKAKYYPLKGETQEEGET